LTRVDCPDGPRFIYADIDTAFPLVLKDVKKKFKAAGKVAKTASVELSSDHDEIVRSILVKIGDQTGLAQLLMRNAYLAYMKDPCNKQHIYDDMLAFIQEREQIAGKVEITLIKMRASLAANRGKGLEEVRRIVDEYLAGAVGLLDAEPSRISIAAKIKAVPKNTEEWRGQ
jgi:hypothetical protein